MLRAAKAVNVYVVEDTDGLRLDYVAVSGNWREQLRTLVHGASQAASDLSIEAWELATCNYPPALASVHASVAEDAMKNNCAVLCARASRKEGIVALKSRMLLAGYLGDSVIVVRAE